MIPAATGTGGAASAPPFFFLASRPPRRIIPPPNMKPVTTYPCDVFRDASGRRCA